MTVKYETLAEMIEQRGTTSDDEICLTQAESGDSVTYNEFDQATDRVAKLLLDEDIGDGDPVAVLMKNTIELVTAIGGVIKAGAVAVPVAPDYTEREIEYILNQSNIGCVLTNEHDNETVAAALDSFAGLHVFTPTDYPGSGLEQPPEIQPTDTALLMYTSGTTGDPKAVDLSHYNLILRFDGGEMPAGQEVFYTLLPLYNIDGFATTFGTMYNGDQVLLRDGFSASSFWEDVDQYGANITSAVPSILAILLDQGVPTELDISSFEVFIVSGSYVHEELVEEFESTFDIPVMEVYGLTEAAGTTFDDVADRVTGSAGTPTKYSEMRIVDEDNGETVPVGELGEVILSGPTVFKEYRNNAAASKEALSGGWFYTGDIGYVDQEGRLYVRDRKKNIIIRGGQNIYPGEIEEILLSHPATQDAAVVGEPHEVYGEVVVAYVIAGLESGQELKSELTSLCEEELAEFKVPNDIHLKESLPRGETGKILKEKLS
jgi:long-chain acyl-CoA synthetase